MAAPVKNSKKSSLLAGFDCSFVLPIPCDLQSECSICLYVLRDPYLVGCCGYRFCRTCIEPIQKKAHHLCPLCNKNFSTLPDRQLERILNNKLVYCSHDGKGCDWKGKLVELENHLRSRSGCLFEQAKCSYCEELFYRGLVGDHEQVCAFKPVLCTYCNDYEDSIHKLQSQHYDKCPMYPAPCPNGCGARPIRNSIAKHVDDSCPLTIVGCTLSVFGCDVKMARKDMPQHEDVMEHMKLAAVTIKQLKEENDRLKEQVSELKSAKPIKVAKPKRAKKTASKSGAGAAASVSVSTPNEAVKQTEYAMPTKCLCVSNLPSGADEQMLKSLFGSFGSVRRVTMNGHVSASVEYLLEDSAKAALRQSKAKGFKLKSVKLIVNPA